MRMRWDLVNLACLLAVALIVRLAVLPVDGHNGDVTVMARWAERMADVGPWSFYDGSGSIYPALLYPLWMLGIDLDGASLDLAIKGLSIPFDLGIGVLLYVFVRGRTTELAGLAVASLYLFNPAVILAGPVWGQVDSAGTLAFLGALLASSSRRDGVAGALAMLAAFFKPQFGLVALPVIAVAAIRSYRARELGSIGRGLGGMALTWVVIGGPLALDPLRYAGLLSNTAQQQPFTSAFAFNPWGLLVGFEIPDDPYVAIGTALLLAGLAGALYGLRRGHDVATLLAVGAMLALAFYFLPTRVHERYLFPVLAVLAPFAAAGPGQFVAYVVLSAGFGASLLYVLHDITPFNLPDPVAAVLVTPTGIWAIGLTMMAASLAWVWMLAVRPPRLPEPEPEA